MRLPDPSRLSLPREPVRLLRRGVRHVVGALLGLVLGALLLLTIPLLLVRWRRPFRAVRRWESGRLDRFYRFRLGTSPEEFLVPRRAALHALLAGVLGYIMADLLLLVAAIVLGSLIQTIIVEPVVFEFSLWVISRPALPVLLIFGTSSLLAAAVFAELAAWAQALLLRRWTSVAREDALETRISRLLTTRRGVVLAIDDERRRIERDLHDGVQQNVVSLSVTLARARRTPDADRARELLDQAHAQSQSLIEEVRQVAWQVYPNAQDEHGLATALGDVADASPLPVHLEHAVSGELPRAVESAAYFVVREAVNNVVKHAAASEVRIMLEERGTEERRTLVVSIRDDGIGGADPEGGGLQGLARRVAALDGTVSVDSPVGGPTIITAEVPCD